jgi:hypothetical protein
VDELLVNMIDGLRASHSTNTFSEPPLARLTDDESKLLANFRRNVDILSTFVGTTNDDLQDYDETDLCLNPADPLTALDKFDAAFKACGQDVNIARESLFNTRRADIDAAMEQWTVSYILYCKKAIVRTMIGLTDAPFDLSFDDEFRAWVEGQASAALRQSMAPGRHSLHLFHLTHSWRLKLRG